MATKKKAPTKKKPGPRAAYSGAPVIIGGVEYISVDEALKRLGEKIGEKAEERWATRTWHRRGGKPIARQALWQMIKDGRICKKIPALKLSQRTTLIPKAEVENFVPTPPGRRAKAKKA